MVRAMLDQELESEIEQIVRRAVEQALELVESRRKRKDMSAMMESGELIETAVAGEIGDCSARSVRTRCQETEDVGAPIGLRLGGQWLVFASLWLIDIEQRKGAHARLEAETRAQKLLKISTDGQGATV